jgi:hypothetical protein
MSESKSRWGSILSGAVAGLESKLDIILADDEQASARSRAAEEAAKKAKLDTPKALKVDQGRFMLMAVISKLMDPRLFPSFLQISRWERPTTSPSSQSRREKRRLTNSWEQGTLRDSIAPTSKPRPHSAKLSTKLGFAAGITTRAYRST